MWTGRQTLGEIEGALSKLRREEGQLDSALARPRARPSGCARERAKALRELARIKLDEMTAGRLVRNLDAAEQRALQILESRRLRLESLDEPATDANRRSRAGRSRAAHARREAVEAAVDSRRRNPRAGRGERQATARLGRRQQSPSRRPTASPAKPRRRPRSRRPSSARRRSPTTATAVRLSVGAPVRHARLRCRQLSCA